MLLNHAAVANFCESNDVPFVVVGPEQPLVDGIADALRAADIKVFGPSAAAAQLEGSKHFTHQLCDEMNVPAAKYQQFDALEPALAYLKEQGAPIVCEGGWTGRR